MNNYMNEFKNFNENKLLNSLPTGNKFLLYDIYLGDSEPENNYQEILEVMKNIILASASNWPNDAEWRKKFSKAFNRYFPDLTREQCDEMLKATDRKNWNDLPWDFGSWLDIMKRRSWMWMGHEKKAKFLLIALAVNDPNASDLEAFDEIFNACGSKMVRRELVML